MIESLCECLDKWTIYLRAGDNETHQWSEFSLKCWLDLKIQLEVGTLLKIIFNLKFPLIFLLSLIL